MEAECVMSSEEDGFMTREHLTHTPEPVGFPDGKQGFHVNRQTGPRTHRLRASLSCSTGTSSLFSLQIQALVQIFLLKF